jgi:hypothetical protein
VNNNAYVSPSDFDELSEQFAQDGHAAAVSEKQLDGVGPLVDHRRRNPLNVGFSS